MAASINAPNLIEITSGHNVTKLRRGEGPTVQVGTVGLTWKVRGEDTGFQFAVYEMDLAPDRGIPLHKHPYAEFFYVIEGRVDFGRLGADGLQEWVSCSAGESVTAPINAPHCFQNRSDQPAEFLSVSTYYHEAVFNEFVGDTGTGKVPSTSGADGMKRFISIAAKYQGYNVEAANSGRLADR